MVFSYSITIALTVMLFFLSISSAEKTESTSEGTPHSTPVVQQQQCSVCWSTESAGHCQHGAKTEPCSDDQLDATVSKLRLINPAARVHAVDNSSTGGHQGKQHKCYTLSATTGVGASRKVFYAKGCTTAAFDPCTGWAKENGECELCTGSNCNAAAPVELGRIGSGLLEGKNKHSSADTIRFVNGLTVMLVASGALMMGGANSF